MRSVLILLVLVGLAAADYKPKRFCSALYTAMDLFKSSKFVTPAAQLTYSSSQHFFHPAGCQEEVDDDLDLEGKVIDTTLRYGLLAISLANRQYGEVYRQTRSPKLEKECRNKVAVKLNDIQPLYRVAPICFTPAQYAIFWQLEEYINKTARHDQNWRTFDCDVHAQVVADLYEVLHDWMLHDCVVFLQKDSDPDYVDPRPEPVTKENFQRLYQEERLKNCYSRHGKEACDEVWPDTSTPVLEDRNATNLTDTDTFKKLQKVLEEALSKTTASAICKDKPTTFRDEASKKQWNILCPEGGEKTPPSIKILEEEFRHASRHDAKYLARNEKHKKAREKADAMPGPSARPNKKI